MTVLKELFRNQWAAIFGAALLMVTPSENRAAGKPNVIVIMADDLGFSDLGCYGGEIETPHIDRLAEEGVRFSGFKNTLSLIHISEPTRPY